MDELEKKRRQLADPDLHLQSLGDIPIDALNHKQLEELKSSQAFESLLFKSMSIDIPEDGIDKVILTQRLKKKKNNYSNWAIAASIMFVSVFSFTILNNPPKSLADEALAHVYSEMNHLTENQVISSDVVRKRLTQLGFSLPAIPKAVTFASKCGFRGNKAMHIVAEIEGQPVTILVTQLSIENNKRFGDERFMGKMRQFSNGNLIVIAENLSLVDQLYKQLTHA